MPQYNSFLARLSPWICIFATISSLFLFAASLPIAHIGIWAQAETPIIALHILTALNALGLVGVFVTRPQLALNALHPFVLCLFAIGFLSYTTLIVSNTGLRHILGSVHMGQGALWWMHFGVMTLACITLSLSRFFRTILIYSACLSFLILVGLHVWQGFEDTGLVPYYFTDYLAFQILAVFILGFCAFKVTPKYAPIILWAGLMVAMFLSDNVIAMAYAALGVPVFLLIFKTALVKPSIQMPLAMSGLTMAPIIALAVLFIILLPSFDRGYYSALENEYLINLISRSYLIEVAIAPLFDAPWRFFTGYGWGGFNEILSQNLPSDWLSFTAAQSQQWDGLRTDHFHSHNEFIEILYGTGIFGAALFFALLVWIPLAAKTRYQLPAFIFAGGWASLSSFWFMMPLSVPYLALTLGVLAARSKRFRVKALRPFVIPVLLIHAGVSFWAAVFLYDLANRTTDYKPKSVEIVAGQTPVCEFELGDAGAGAVHLSRLMVGRARYALDLQQNLQKAANTPEEIDVSERSLQEQVEEWNEFIGIEIPRINHLYCQSDVYLAQHEPSNRLKVSRILIRGEVLLSLTPWMDAPTIAYYEASWEEELSAWLRDAPDRADLAVPYILYHLLNAKEGQIESIVRQIYSQTPEHPVGLWYKGLLLLGEPAQVPRGVAMMRDAYTRGIERFVPVDDATKDALGLQ